MYKHWVHEGGIASPLIARWQAGVARRGSLNHEPTHLIDIMATCVDVGGGKPPNPMEGRSLASAFSGRGTGPERALFWEHEGNRAARRGRWKLVSRHGGGWELYDLAADRTESRDLAAAHPDRARELAAAWDHWAARCGVEPWEKVQKS
jgi:arylsulfatase